MYKHETASVSTAQCIYKVVLFDLSSAALVIAYLMETFGMKYRCVSFKSFTFLKEHLMNDLQLQSCFTA